MCSLHLVGEGGHRFGSLLNYALEIDSWGWRGRTTSTKRSRTLALIPNSQHLYKLAWLAKETLWRKFENL